MARGGNLHIISIIRHLLSEVGGDVLIMSRYYVKLPFGRVSACGLGGEMPELVHYR